MFKSLIAGFILFLLMSCNSNYKLKDGSFRAYVEKLNTENDNENAFAARVEVENGVVKKIISTSGQVVKNFDFWETKSQVRQNVFDTGPYVYSVYLIEDDY